MSATTETMPETVAEPLSPANKRAHQRERRTVMFAGPRPGDILVSNRSATVEHDISIVPRAPHLTCRTHNAAVTCGAELAKELRVDVWLTEDHTHFLMIDSYRAAP